MLLDVQISRIPTTTWKLTKDFVVHAALGLDLGVLSLLNLGSIYKRNSSKRCSFYEALLLTASSWQLLSGLVERIQGEQKTISIWVFRVWHRKCHEVKIVIFYNAYSC